MSYTQIGYEAGWHTDLDISGRRERQERLTRSTRVKERQTKPLSDFPEDVLESRSKEIGYNDLDQLAVAVGWEPRGEGWNVLLDEATKVVSLWHQSGTLIGFARMVQANKDATLSDGMIHPDFQTKGYFKLLIERGIREMKDDGIETAYLDAKPGTEEMYRRLGWKAVSRLAAPS
jgi:GNAT superfamily N-acetyltransferase